MNLSTLLLLSVILSSSCDVFAQEFFSETFEDGNFADDSPVTWAPGSNPGGRRDASSGDFVMTTEVGQASDAYVVGRTFDNVSITTLLSQVTPSEIEAFGVFSRSMGASSYLSFIETDGTIGIWTWFGNNGQSLGSFETGIDPTSTDVWMEFNNYETTLSLRTWVDGEARPARPQVLVIDNNVTSGTLGVWSNSKPGDASSVVYRSFEVSELVLNPTDVNRDGIVAEDDFSLLCTSVRRARGDEAFDLNNDGEINTADVDSFIEQAGWLAGDIDLNGTVQFEDFLELSSNFGTLAQDNWADGDFNCDREVDFADFLQLSGNFAITSEVAAASVPEPNGFISLFVGLISVLRMRRQNVRG